MSTMTATNYYPALGNWEHPSPFTHGDKPESMAFLREQLRDSKAQIAKLERMASEKDAEVGGSVDAARLRKWADAERVSLAELTAELAARKAGR